jgi:hypothetical protein
MQHMAGTQRYPLPQQSPPAPLTAAQQKPLTADQARQELHQAIEGSGEVLATSTTVFSIFPDTLTIDRAKLTVTKRKFWMSAEVMSIRIEDVLNVTAALGPVFGSVSFTSRIFNNEKPYVINRFWREDAMHMKRILQGYIIAMQRGIDCSALTTPELAHMLDQLGEDNHEA